MIDLLNSEMIRLHHRGSGPAVVMLHCLGVDRHMWDFTAANLSGRFTILTYDFPGHAKRPVPARPYGIEDLSAELADVLDRSRITKAHVVGISMGGLVAQHFAATHADKVDRLVLADTTARYTDELRRMWAERVGPSTSG